MTKFRNALASGTMAAFALIAPATLSARLADPDPMGENASAASAFAVRLGIDDIGGALGGGTNPGGGGSARNN
ncbi:hypothetical protein [Streptosporangium carneum]|uniref:Uncharacterized protein n=1 Tax=Streptosporangium carneum TaxID=47481 RepID=A0A9W6HX43_9ACTN|nr:hypothetical protein [Streptosporangium carneum]GLK07672.1 hypothetical protein GCM10017600_10770 [Streptosporangium carneum]